MANADLARFLFMAGTKADPEHEPQIKESLSSGQCIQPGCTNRFHSRGLCVSHANEFFGKKRGKTAEEWAKFENVNIRAGRVLASGSQRQLVRMLNKQASFVEAE